MRGVSGRVGANLVFLVIFALTVTMGAFLSFVSGVLFQNSYEITVPMPEAGGILPLQEVTVLGRAVGQVSDVELTEEGVVITLEIDGDQQVPKASIVRVLRRSPIGEQAVDFEPVSAPWEPAERGAHIEPVEQIVPAEIPFLLEETVELFEAIDKNALSIVVEELATALDGRGATLKQLNRDVIDLNETFVAAIPTYQRLIDSSEPVLQTLADHADDLRALFRDAAELAEVLAENRPTLDRLLDTAPPFLAEAEALVINTRANLQCLMEDVDDLNEMLLGPSTATGAPASLYDSKMDEVLMLLDMHQSFYQLGFNVVLQHDPRTGVKWARIQLASEEEGGQVYPQKRPTPATLPGAACQSEPWGTGVNAVRQADHQPHDETSPGILWAPIVDETGPGRVDPPPTSGGDGGGPATPATGGGLAGLAITAIAAATLLRRRT